MSPQYDLNAQLSKLMLSFWKRKGIVASTTKKATFLRWLLKGKDENTVLPTMWWLSTENSVF